MLTNKYSIHLKSPSVEEFSALRSKIGWGQIDFNIAGISLNNSLFHVTVRYESQLIGMGRVVGDGAMYFYIQDVVVDPNYQNMGIGNILMKKIESYLAASAKQGSTISLLAAKDKENFYTKYGYILRPNDSLGHGMCKFL